MKKNMGRLDRMLRIIGAVVVSLLLVTGVLSGVWAVVCGIIAAAWLLTGLIAWCPVYVPFGICTDKKGSCKNSG